MESRVKIAIQKNGRLSTESLSILKKCGIEFSDSNNKLIIKSTNMSIDLLMVRDDDIPRLVSQNIADLGIVGENVVYEKQLSDTSLKLKTILKLGFSRCRLSFAKPKEMNLDNINNKKIATSYPGIVKDYLEKKNINAEIIEIHGSVELTPFVEISNDITFATDVTRLTSTDFNVLSDNPVKNENGFSGAILDAANQVKRFGIELTDKKYARIGFTSDNSADLSVKAILRGNVYSAPTA